MSAGRWWVLFLLNASLPVLLTLLPCLPSCAAVPTTTSSVTSSSFAPPPTASISDRHFWVGVVCLRAVTLSDTKMFCFVLTAPCPAPPMPCSHRCLGSPSSPQATPLKRGFPPRGRSGPSRSPLAPRLLDWKLWKSRKNSSDTRGSKIFGRSSSWTHFLLREEETETMVTGASGLASASVMAAPGARRGTRPSSRRRRIGRCGPVAVRASTSSPGGGKLIGGNRPTSPKVRTNTNATLFEKRVAENESDGTQPNPNLSK